MTTYGRGRQPTERLCRPSDSELNPHATAEGVRGAKC